MKKVKILLILPYFLIVLALIVLGLSYLIDINKYIVYGKSRYQCKKTLEKLKEGLKGHKITSYDKQELLIDYDYGNELTQTSIEKYNKMVNFIKTYNIKKFPFITYKEEEQ